MCYSASAFIQHEMTTLAHNIEILEKSLRRYATDDAAIAGNVSLLQIQQHSLGLLYTLQPYSADTLCLLEACRTHLKIVTAVHLRLSREGEAHDLRHAEAWWQTLNEMEFLADFTNRLAHYRRQQEIEGTQPAQ